MKRKANLYSDEELLRKETFLLQSMGLMAPNAIELPPSRHPHHHHSHHQHQTNDEMEYIHKMSKKNELEPIHPIKSEEIQSPKEAVDKLERSISSCEESLWSRVENFKVLEAASKRNSDRTWMLYRASALIEDMTSLVLQIANGEITINSQYFGPNSTLPPEIFGDISMEDIINQRDFHKYIRSRIDSDFMDALELLNEANFEDGDSNGNAKKVL